MDHPTAQSINGEIRRGDNVIAANNNDYAFLVGEVINIVKHGTPEHAAETDNDTDSVHVNFKAFNYPPWQQNSIAEYFEGLYGTGETMLYDELSLDDVIMAPDMLILITDLSEDRIHELVCDAEEAVSFCDGFVGGNDDSAKS